MASTRPKWVGEQPHPFREATRRPPATGHGTLGIRAPTSIVRWAERLPGNTVHLVQCEAGSVLGIFTKATLTSVEWVFIAGGRTASQLARPLTIRWRGPKGRCSTFQPLLSNVIQSRKHLLPWLPFNINEPAFACWDLNSAAPGVWNTSHRSKAEPRALSRVLHSVSSSMILSNTTHKCWGPQALGWCSSWLALKLLN